MVTAEEARHGTHSAGFRVIIPRQCVADRVPLTHLVNLLDMDSKYGDVMDVEDVIAAFQRLPAAP